LFGVGAIKGRDKQGTHIKKGLVASSKAARKRLAKSRKGQIGDGGDQPSWPPEKKTVFL